MKKFIVNPVTGDYESTSYTFGDRFDLKDGGRINFDVGGDVSKAYKILSQRLNRAPSLAEIRVETGLSYNGIKNNLGNLKLSEGITRNEAANKAAVEAAKNKRKIFDNTIKEPLSKDLEKRYQYVQGNEYKKAAREGKFLNNEQLAKKYKLTVSQIERAIAKIKQDLKLSAPKQTYEGTEKRERERDTKRKKNIKKTSSRKIEEKIKKAIKTIDSKALTNDVDLAHRASVKANANLGADYLATSLGIDAKIVNQQYVRSTEQKLGKLYDDQKKLIKGLEPDKIPKETQKKIEKLNIKISQLSDRTKGALQGVLIDEKTLKPYIYGKDYKKVFGAGLIDDDVTVKKLTQEQIEIGKLNTKEQIKAAKGSQAKITNLRNTAQNFVNKMPGKAFRMVPAAAAAAVDYAVFAGFFGVPVDEAIIGASGWLTKKPEIGKALGTVAMQYSEGKINLKELGEKAIPILKEIGEENLPESKIKNLSVINNINENSIDIPEIDDQYMAAEGGRVNFSEGSPNPDSDFLKMTMAARENENIPFNPIKNFNEIINPKAFAGYAQKIVSGAMKLPEYAARLIPAAGEVARDVLTKKPGSYLNVPSELFPFSGPGADIPVPGLPKGTLENFGKSMQPKATEALIEKIGLQKMIDESDAKATGSQKYYGDMLELGTELLGPATAIGYFTAAGKLTKSGIKELQKISGKNFPKIKAQMEEKISAAGESRRDFNKTVAVGGMIGLAKVLGLDSLLTTTAKVASKVPAKIVTAGGTPQYFFDFVSLIRKSGNDVSDKAATLERQKVYDYKGYTMVEDLSTGEIKINKTNEGVGSGTDDLGEMQIYDTIDSQEEILYKPSETIQGKDGKAVKTLDEYEEATAKPDSYGDMDSDSGLDSIDEILDLLSKDGKTYSKTELSDMGLDLQNFGNKKIDKAGE